MPANRPPTGVAAGVAGIGLIAALAQLYATAPGVGATPDSRSYVEAARRLASTGRLTITAAGFPAPLVHFPPLLSMVLAAFQLVGIDALAADRWLNCVLLLATALITGWLIYRLTSGASWAALGVSLLVVVTTQLFVNYLFALSEPLFNLLILLAFFCLSWGAGSNGKWAPSLAGLCVGLAWVTRYVGGTFAVSLGLWLLVQSGSWRARLERIFRFGLPAVAPYLAWSLRNILLTGAATNRLIAYQPIPAATWLQFFQTDFLKLAVAVILAGIAAQLLRPDWPATRRRLAAQPVTGALWLSLLVYAVGLLVSIAFADRTTPLDDRILAPATIILAIAAVSTLTCLALPARPAVWFWRALAVIYGVYVPGAAVFTFVLAFQGNHGALWYTGVAWQQSGVMAYVRTLPPETPIYTNGADAIYLQTERTTRPLPLKPDGPYQSVAAYNQATAAMEQDVLHHNGAIVFFAGINGASLSTPSDVDQLMPGLRRQQLADGFTLDAGH